MDWLTLLMQVLNLMMADKVDEDGLVNLFGGQVQRSERRWRIEPASEYKDSLSRISFHIEGLRNEQQVVSTVELHLTTPWRTSLATLERALGSPSRRMPARPSRIMPGGANSPSLRIFAFDIKHESKTGVVTIAGRPPSSDLNNELEITEIRIRRLYD